MTTDNRLLGFLGLCSKAGKLVTGTEIVTEKIRQGKKIYLVVIANDVSQNTLKRIKDCCDYYGKKYVIASNTMNELSHAVGKKSDVSSLGITDTNFSDEIIKLLKEVR